MKKFLVILAMLAMVPMASAAVIALQGEGTTVEATAGDTVRVYVTSSITLLSLDALLSVDGGDVITGAVSKADAADYGADPEWSFDPQGLGTAAVNIGVGNFMGIPAGTVGYVDVLFTGGEQVVSIAASQVFGGSADGTTYTPLGADDFSAGVVTIVPEPITVALLGLGGLFLRRRRA